MYPEYSSSSFFICSFALRIASSYKILTASGDAAGEAYGSPKNRDFHIGKSGFHADNLKNLS